VKRHCTYCRNIFSSMIQDQREPWDKIIHETSGFVVTPTVGALIEGWTLIISRRHVPAMGALTEEEFYELKDLVVRVRNLVEQEYGNTIIFEHGPACEGTNFGCGIDHAHFHVVPLSISIAPLVEVELESNLMWETIADLRDLSKIHQKGISYLYILENGTNRGILARLQDIPSQFMRRLIASLLGIPNLYDYREYSFRQNVVETSRRLVAAYNKDKCLV